MGCGGNSSRDADLSRLEVNEEGIMTIDNDEVDSIILQMCNSCTMRSRGFVNRVVKLIVLRLRSGTLILCLLRFLC